MVWLLFVELNRGLWDREAHLDLDAALLAGCAWSEKGYRSMYMIWICDIVWFESGSE